MSKEISYVTPLRGIRVLCRSLVSLVQDVRSGFRGLRTRPGFTFVAVAMLGLGIGINGAVFAVVDAALLKGYRHVQRNDRIVQVGTTKDYIYYPDFVEWRAQTRSFDDLALVRGVFHTLDTRSDDPDTAFTTEVTTNTFRLLGVTPFVGRDFLPGDAEPGAEPVTILRHDAWVRRFGANLSVIGRSVRVDGVPTTIVGVMPEGFSFPAQQELWTPLVPTAAALRRETGYARYAYARLAEGVSLETARAELETVGRRLEQTYPGTNENMAPVVSGFDQWFVGAGARTLYQGLWAAVGCVLLIVCVNVANLLVLQAIGQSHEVSVRLALGAGRWRLIRQFVIESLLLSSLGGAIGWWVAEAGVRLFTLAQPDSAVLAIELDRSVVVYLVAISAATGLAAGLATATPLMKLSASGVSTAASRTVAGSRGGTRLSYVFVGVEMALAVVLLAGAGVTIRSLVRVSTANVGVEAANVLTASLYLPPERYTSADARLTFYRDLGERLAVLPGVESVAFGAVAPTERTPHVAFELADAPALDARTRPTTATCVISPGYFRTLGVSIVAGRDFRSSDRAADVPVVLVNQRFADLQWPGQPPLGKRLRLFSALPGAPPTEWLTVVGVASNIVQNDRTRQAFEPIVYVPYAQQPQPNMFAFARSQVPLATLATAVRREVYVMEPTLPVPALWPLRTRLDRAYALERNTTALLGGFAVVALVLATVGLYAVVAHAVSHRTREIGIRLAVGATRGNILALVFKRGLWAAGIGLLVGLPLSLAVNRLLQSQLAGVSPTDPFALMAASLVLVVAAVLGCWLPARRAARVNPVVALTPD
jgi:putative ABC transport system permease protein